LHKKKCGGIQRSFVCLSQNFLFFPLFTANNSIAFQVQCQFLYRGSEYSDLRKLNKKLMVKFKSGVTVNVKE